MGATAPLAEETDRIVNSVVIAADVLTRGATGARPAATARGTPAVRAVG